MAQGSDVPKGLPVRATVLLVSWIVIWPATAFLAFVEGLDLSTYSPRPFGRDEFVLLLIGLLIGVLVPLIAAWICRESRTWRRVSVAAAGVGAFFLWLSIGIRVG